MSSEDKTKYRGVPTATLKDEEAFRQYAEAVRENLERLQEEANVTLLTRVTIVDLFNLGVITADQAVDLAAEKAREANPLQQ